MPFDNRGEPLAYIGYWIMHSLTKFKLNLLQFCSQLLALRLADNRKHPITPFLPANVRETKEDYNLGCCDFQPLRLPPQF